MAALSAELTLATDYLDRIDQKAALVPAVVAAVAALFIAPDTHFTLVQGIILVPALVFGIAAVWFALQTLETKPISLGGEADQIAKGDHYEPADFNHAMAGSLARAVNLQSELTRWKGRRLNWSMRCAGVTLLALALARIAGGL